MNSSQVTSGPVNHFDLTTSASLSSERLVSEATSFYFKLIVDYWITLLINILGIVTNIINIIVFHRQGFGETVNISLAYIAVWDLVNSITGVTIRLHYPLGLVQSLLGVIYQKSSWPYLTYISLSSGYVSYALATYVSISRCLCVVVPFKVKFRLNRRFTLIMVNAISLIIFSAYSYSYSFYIIGHKFSAFYNVSFPTAQCSDVCKSHPGLITSFKYLSIILPTSCFIVLCISSAITVSYLKKSLNFHYRSTYKETVYGKDTPKGSISKSKKEAKVSKTVLTVIAVYIGNLFPRIAGTYLPSIIEPEFYENGKYYYLFFLVADTVSVLDAINASVNLFLFLSMSTNFTTAFYEVFPACKKKMTIQ